MRKSVFILFISVFFIQSINSQAYQILGKDNTGNNIESALPGLIEVADRIIDSLPAEFEDFKVYSISFYLHNPDFEGGIPSIFLSAIDSVDNLSPYSLLIGRQMSETYLNYKFWVRLKLPDSDIFQCFTDEDFVFIQTKLHNVLNKGLPNNSVNGFIQPEKDAMAELISIISKAKTCCQRNPVECTLCQNDISLIRNTMEQFGFVSVPITGLTKSSSSDTIGNFEEYTELSVSIGNNNININDDVEVFINKMGLAMQGVSGSIYFYDYTASNCNEILQVITNGISEEYFSLIGNYNITRNPPNFDNVTYNVTIIGTTDQNNRSKLHVRILKPNVSPPSGSKILLRCLYSVGETCEIDLHGVKEKLIEFYSLLGDYTFTNDNGITEHVANLIPDIQTTGFLNISQVKNNVIVLFGTNSEIINTAQLEYTRLLKEEAYAEIPTNDREDPNICDFYFMEEFFEMGINPGNISLVRTDISEENRLFWKASSLEELDAFFALHATGHNAGCSHNMIRSIKNSYMSSGCCIVNHYLARNQLGCECEASADYIFQTLQNFVSTTMNTSSVNNFDHIKALIYEKYIK